ncbi:DUF4362 domain-containing protein [Sporosarcina sp. Te-1]|uniref:DUF4362 domain-containing protein n=1 Tax=Sporosarcina sp. Te-1 TaxID=2818390 RepID=UPI001A9D13DB|nr:DUF4362 domain-containing protein [Sporosarcina sp. Te-1]QTD41906.1 DUF4362 domain-containing protein [Sporosarcina sp. Te-1]
MNKRMGVLFIVLWVIQLIACGQDKEGSSTKSVEDVDVINHHRGIEGLEKMERFYSDFQNGKTSDLRIVHYTLEGDPIVTDLAYDGKKLQVTFDSSRDAFGSGEIHTIACNGLFEEVYPANRSYLAYGCEEGLNGMAEILSIEYDLNRQDLFEFQLKYGKGLENELDTKRGIKKIGLDSNMAKTSDVQLSPDVMQELYKRLILANYLGEKDLKNRCHAEKDSEYYLKVYLNGGEDEFAWSTCHNSADTTKFTDLANYLIMQADNPPSEISEPTIQGYVLQVENQTLLVAENINQLEYQWIEEEIKKTDFDAYGIEFYQLEGMDPKEFKPGDKVLAILKGGQTEGKPRKVKVKDIRKLESVWTE